MAGMRVPLPAGSSPRIAAAVAGAVALGAVAAASFGPIVRHEIRAQAARRRLAVTAEEVWPGWGGVILGRVSVRAEGVPGVEVHAREVRIQLGWTFRAHEIVCRGAVVDAHGTTDALRAQVDAWRSQSGVRVLAARQTPGPTVRVEDATIRWEDGSGRPHLTAAGVGAELSRDGGQVTIAELSATFSHARLLLARGTARWNGSRQVEVARAAKLVVERTGAQTVAESQPASRPAEPLPPSAVVSARDSRPVSSAAARSVGGAARRIAKATPAQPEHPAGEEPPWSISAPDLQAVRATVAEWTRKGSNVVADGADIGVDALTWKVSESDDDAPLTIGPGVFRVLTEPKSIELQFRTDAGEVLAPSSTRLAASIKLPREESDVTATIDGGPVSLTLLGVHEGALGLVDVDKAMVGGRARLTLAADASSLSFEIEGSTRSLAIRSARLAADVVRGIDLDVRVRGRLSAPANLRLDEASLVLGATHLSASGILNAESDHVEGAFRFDMPTISCDSFLDSFPSALLPTLDETKLGGTFAASGHLAFDTRSLDDLLLEYDVRDRCQFVDVPPQLARERFTNPFEHRVYMPDGKIAVQTTGPGTVSWTAIEDISPYMQVAVLTTEDGAFPRHHGFNRAAIRASIIANLKAARFVRGASTITMQLAKNLFLSRDKTLARKLEEVALTEYLEQTFSKGELMEMYLNVIEFGPGIYGITEAADYYFGRTPAELNLVECLFLASVLPSPLRYASVRDAGALSEGRMKGLHTLMEIAHRNGRIDDVDLAEGETETIDFWRGGERPPPRPPARLHGAPAADVDDVSLLPTSLDDTR